LYLARSLSLKKKQHWALRGPRQEKSDVLSPYISIHQITCHVTYNNFKFYFYFSDHTSLIIFGVAKPLMLYLLHRKISRIALLEIDHSQDRTYPSVPQTRFHDIFLFSHGNRSFSLPSWRNLVVFLLDDVSLSLFKCLKYYFLLSSVSSKDTQYMNINRDEIIWIGANAPFQPKFIWSTYRPYKFNISLLETIDENQESSYRQIGCVTSNTPAIRELINQTF
jgi:hypothetical protein